MTDHITAYAAQLVADPAALEKLLRDHPEIVPEIVPEPETDPLTAALRITLRGAVDDGMIAGVAAFAHGLLARDGYQITKIRTDEERLQEAREAAALYLGGGIDELKGTLAGLNDSLAPVRSALIALEERDGVL